MILNDYGEIVEKHLQKIPKYYPDIKLLEYVIMPNHIHGILWFTKYIGDPNPVGAIHESPNESPNDKNPEIVGAIHVGAIHELPLRNNQKTQFKHRNHRRNMALSKIIGRFKMQSAKQINILRNMTGHPVWQRNYYEHIIRDEESYLKIAEYIINNPSKWKEDKYYAPPLAKAIFNSILFF